MKISINCDFSLVKKKLGAISAHTPDVTKSSMMVAMDEFKNDALNKVPKCPFATGRLYDSHRTFVRMYKNKAVGTLKAGGSEAPYAFSLHEGAAGKTHAPISHWTRPGSGPHWILSKAVRYRHKYFSLISREFKKRMKRVAR